MLFQERENCIYSTIALTHPFRYPLPSSSVQLSNSSIDPAILTPSCIALFPKLLEFYRNLEAPTTFSKDESPTVLAHILQYLNAYKAFFARPIDSRYDIVLLGGALGSLFS